MKSERKVLQIGDYRTLPLFSLTAVATEGIPAFGKGKVRFKYVDPPYDPFPFDYSRDSLDRISRDASYASQVVSAWSAHLTKLTYYAQFRDDPAGELFQSFHPHTELTSEIFCRLGLDPKPLWDIFEWLLGIKFVQEEYRADKNCVQNYERHAEKLAATVDREPDSRFEVHRLVERAKRILDVKIAEWEHAKSTQASTRLGCDNGRVSLFYVYSHKDEELRDELAKHLAILQRNGHIDQWHDRHIGPGDVWRCEIDQHLSEAELVLLLLSAVFLASDDCYDVALDLALKRHQDGTARIIPIFVRPCDWVGCRFSSLQGSPRDAKPVTSWPNRDETFTDIATHILWGRRENRSGASGLTSQWVYRCHCRLMKNSRGILPTRREADRLTG